MLLRNCRIVLLGARCITQPTASRTELMLCKADTSRPASSLIKVDPEHDLIDSPTRIRVEGLKAKEKITLQLTMLEDDGMEFSSYVHYLATAKGDVDTTRDYAIGGSYEGIFPAGLQATLKTTPKAYAKNPNMKYSRLTKTAIDRPYQYTLSVLPGHLNEEELNSSFRRPENLGTSSFSRALMGPGVRRIPIEGEAFVGSLLLPAGKGPFPTVMDLQGFTGGLNERRTALLASHGFASIAVAYIKHEKLPKFPTSIPLEYFEEGLNYLQAHEDCQKGAVGLVGTSKGAELCIILPAYFDVIKASVALNGYNVPMALPYSYRGKVIHPAHLFNNKNSVTEVKDGIYRLIPDDSMYRWDHPKSLPVEKIPDNCEVLIVTSDRDGSQSYRSGVALLERARRHGKENIYGLTLTGIGHFIDPPYFNVTPIVVFKPTIDNTPKQPYWFGGEPYRATQSNEIAWYHTLRLLERKLVHEPCIREIKKGMVQ